MNPHLPENTIGMALVLAVLSLGVISLLQILVAGTRRSIRFVRSWWRNRQALQSWQPRRRPMIATRRPR
jgi:hypothetical protein